MENLVLRFPHIGLQIFEQLDDDSLTNCGKVSKSLQKFIDDHHLVWIRIVKIPTLLRTLDWKYGGHRQRIYKEF